MHLTDAELAAIHDVIYNEAYYGDDEVVYGNGDHAVALRLALAKVEDEAKRRNLW
jgi:hypothetical protein